MLSEYERKRKAWRQSPKARKGVWATSVITNHKARGCHVQFTQPELKRMAEEATCCPLCDAKFDWSAGVCRNTKPSLDRINNEDEMTLQNVWIICHNCNTTKGARTLQEFIEYCRKVVENDTLGRIRSEGGITGPHAR